MKKPKPVPPTNAPIGTIWFGGPIDWLKIKLSIRDEYLVPEEITAMMRREPNRTAQKDKPLYRGDGKFLRVAKAGAWVAILEPDDTDEWDCGEAMLELMATLPRDPAIWHDLATKYEVSISVALNMVSANKGFVLSPDVLLYLGERRITADFDVYHNRGREIFHNNPTERQ